MPTHPKPFPTHFKIILDPQEQSALENLYELAPHLRDEVELIHKAIQKGIVVLNQEATARKKEPEYHPTRSELQASGSHQVENYVGIPLEERLRRKLQAFLDAHPDAMPEEKAYALLLELGVDRAADRHLAKMFKGDEGDEHGGEDFSLDFPSTVVLDLDQEQRSCLEQLANKVPHEDDAELASMVLWRGINDLRKGDDSPMRVDAQRRRRLRLAQFRALCEAPRWCAG